MKDFIRESYNYIIVSAVISWAVAQILKAVINSIKLRTFNAERLIGPGGMPSAHSAFVSSAAIAVMKAEGLSSTEFAISFVIAIVVMYDAMSVRRHAGYHAREINLLKEKNKISESKKLKEVLGHTPLEVTCGALLGILIAFLVPMKI